MCPRTRPSGKCDSATLPQSTLCRAFFDIAITVLALLTENKKPTVGLVTGVGCLRFDLAFPYRAFPPHNGAL
jgi:hypothetical protein